MGNMRSLLLAGDPGNEFKSGLLNVISLIFTALGILMVLYAVYLFFLMATASDESKRRSAKSRVVKTFASIFIVVALIGMLQGLKITITTPKIDNPIDNVILPVGIFDEASVSASWYVEYSSKTTYESKGNKSYRRWRGTIELKKDDVKGVKGTVTKITNFWIAKNDKTSPLNLDYSFSPWPTAWKSRSMTTDGGAKGVFDGYVYEKIQIESKDYDLIVEVEAVDKDGETQKGMVYGALKTSVQMSMDASFR